MEIANFPKTLHQNQFEEKIGHAFVESILILQCFYNNDFWEMKYSKMGKLCFVIKTQHFYSCMSVGALLLQVKDSSVQEHFPFPSIEYNLSSVIEAL